MSHTEVCAALAAAGFSCSRRYVNELVIQGRLKVERLSYHFVKFNPAEVRRFIAEKRALLPPADTAAARIDSMLRTERKGKARL